MSEPRDILDEARDFLRSHRSADEVARYPTAALVLRLADELRQTRAAFGDIDGTYSHNSPGIAGTDSTGKQGVCGRWRP